MVAVGRQMPIPRRQRYLQRRAALLAERRSFEEVWRDAADQILPRRARFFTQDRNRKRRNTKIIDPFPRLAQETLVNFLMENMCSKARPWYGMAPAELGLGEIPRVRDYCVELVDVLRYVMAQSNYYATTKTCITDLVVFGSASGQFDEDEDDLIRGYNFPIGQFLFANSARLRVDTVYRDFSMTTAQMVERFGYERCSPLVRAAWDNHRYDDWHEVLHVVEPNRAYNPLRSPQALGWMGQPWRSCYLEIGGKDPSYDELLAEEGNFEFPIFAARWDVLGEDVYGSSIGMDALGACTHLQLMHKRLAALIDKTVSPPMNAPTSAQSRTVSTLSGDWNFYDVMVGGQKIEPSIVIPPASIEECRQNIAMYREQITKIFRNDVYLFNLRSQQNGESLDITATEATIRDQEKLQLLGAMTDRIEDEYFEPSIMRILGILQRGDERRVRQGLKPRLPKPPPELLEVTADGRVVGKRLKIEYVSEMAQAKKAVRLAALQRYAAFVGQVTEIKGLPPAADGKDPRDGVNFDGAVRSFGDSLYLSGEVQVPPEQVERDRAARQQAQEEAQQAALASERARAARDLAGSPVDPGNALGRSLEEAEGLAGAA